MHILIYFVKDIFCEVFFSCYFYGKAVKYKYELAYNLLGEMVKLLNIMATYQQIREFIKDQNGFSVMTGWIAHVKEMCNLPMRIAPNRINPLKRVNPCPPSKIVVIKEALRHFGMIE